MAIEMPAVVTDRLPHPDWTPASSGVERARLPAQQLLDALEQRGAPDSVLQPLRAAAASGSMVELLLSPDHTQVLLSADGRRLLLTGPAREAALAVLEGEPAHGAAEAQAAGSGPAPAALPLRSAIDADAQARVAAVAAELREAFSGESLPSTEPALPPDEPPAFPLAEALLRAAPGGAAADPVAQAAAGLSRTVEQSGLFLEAHVAQWLAGTRSWQQIQDELGAAGPVGASGEQRGALQLDVLQRQALRLDGLAWEGQPVHIDIDADAQQRQSAEAAAQPAVFQATVTLQLPHLGMLHARVRAAEKTVGLQIESAQASALRPELAALAAALAARGLSLVELQLAEAPGDSAGKRP